ncbi:MAG: hypothetical protein A3H13_00570 [Candidatus Taylorbacteria bacterium RIFCSPLOWO2_12_FULL_48_11]|nr:MAG: hypothetical protein A2670_02505 [Candidatus Taylorbacteria bacterium RIFCSPHIGHO2_01_FULL_48_38]OHA40510.1 MAG: hypothetical protein A3J31_00140 [Candidatus Taylorbacteria bacterium RIFCSPLOWO2_02_FULL_48_16]OHA45602.1 MAG: hypothetical protein A3H13_00570 [Candidatus Taylorbacteria bacterium RIFCSPLOWO2_12_FULL_48_11]
MIGFLYLVIIAAGVAGFFLSLHIHRKKRAQERLVCPIGFDCDAVIHSKYSSFLGVPLEVGGMLYYAAISIVYILLLTIPDLFPNSTSLVALVISGIALLFSIYLTGVQMFVIKQWCSWCLISAVLSAVIFAAAFWIALS